MVVAAKRGWILCNETYIKVADSEYFVNRYYFHFLYFIHRLLGILHVRSYVVL